MNPNEAVLAVTYRCNCQCSMCNIWKEKPEDEMPPSEYLKLPSSLRTVNVSGGEPFLRPDLDEVVNAIHARLPKARLVFSTNGLMTETIVSAVDRYQSYHNRIGVGISIDGMEASHDRIRGVEGAFRKAMSTVDGMKEIGIEDLRIGMTILGENVEDVARVFEFSRRIGLEFTATFAHDSEVYFKKTDNARESFGEQMRRPLSNVIRQQLKSAHPKDWFRALHMQGIIDVAVRNAFMGECEAGRRYFFMDPYGNIFPCNVMNAKIGNLTSSSSWEALCVAGAMDRTRLMVRQCRRDCWMVCNTRSLMIAHPLKTCGWVFKGKIRAHLNRNPA